MGTPEHANTALLAKETYLNRTYCQVIHPAREVCDDVQRLKPVEIPYDTCWILT
jgi:hypothetical protein